MGKKNTEKQRVAEDLPPLPKGVGRATAIGPPHDLGAAYVAFDLEAVPGVEVVLCLDKGGMVGVVLKGAVSTRALQRIPLRMLERYALAFLAAGVDFWRQNPEDGFEDLVEHLVGSFDRAVKPLPPPEGSRERRLAWVAARYVELCGETGSPTKALAEELGFSAATVRDQLGDARRRGLLDKPGKGRAGGHLTPKAQALLSTDEAAG